jgi:hypothetical protein
MITINIRTLLIVLIIILLVVVIILQFVAISKIKSKIKSQENKSQDIMNLMMMNVLNNMNTPNTNNHIIDKGNAQPILPNEIPIIKPSCDADSPQTNFFAKSIDHAEKNLTGKIYLDGYRYGGAMDLTRIDDNTKKSIIIAMKYMMIDPVGARDVEQKFRLISEQENVPLWFVILHESIKKLIPIDNHPSITQISIGTLLAEIERRKAKQVEETNAEGSKIVSINNVA